MISRMIFFKTESLFNIVNDISLTTLITSLFVCVHHANRALACTLLNCAMWVAGAELVYQTIRVRTIAFCTVIKYYRGKTARFPLLNDDLSKDQELLMSWSYERSKK